MSRTQDVLIPRDDAPLTPVGTEVFSASGIRKSFGPVRALVGVDYTLRAGEVNALMGENGAGKSTLLKVIGGDYQPDAGELLLRGEPVSFADPVAARRAGVRVIAQEPEILAHVSVAENIFVGAIARFGLGFRREALNRRADAEIERLGFGGMLEARTLGRDLSAAQRQLVEIIRALVDRPSVVLFDEPTSSLGEVEVRQLFSLIRSLRRDGTAIGYVSHRMAEVFELADRVTVLRDGGLVGTKPASELETDDLIRMMVGRDLTNLFARTKTEPGAEVLHVAHVSNEFVKDVSLTVRAGEVVGIAGLVGAGRSELMKTIVGDFAVRSGTLAISGAALRFHSPADSVRDGIGFAPEERKTEALIMERSVRDNISLALLKSLSRWIFVQARAERALARRQVERLRIRTPSIEQRVRNLSGGNQQKVVLARQLSIAPRLLLLDEPTRGVDVGAKAEIYAIIDELAQQGVAILVVSSELPEVLGLADRIYVMAGGRITGELPRADANEERILGLAMNTAA